MTKYRQYRLIARSRNIESLSTGVVIDGGAGVNIMAEHTRRGLGIIEMKEDTL